MKTLQLISCRRCGKMYFSGSKKIQIDPGEEIYETLRRVARCTECKLGSDRSAGGANKRYEHK